MAEYSLMLGLSAGLLTLGGGLLFLQWLAKRQTSRRIRRRLGVGGENSEGKSQQTLTNTFMEILADFYEGMPEFLRDSEVPALLARAGWRGQTAEQVFSVIRLATPLVLLLASLILFSGKSLTLVLFVAAAVGFLLPKIVLRWWAGKRARQIVEEIPILIHLLRTMFEAGLSLEQALIETSQTNPRVLPQLSWELAGVVRQIGAGMDAADALNEMASSLDIPELTDLMKMLRQMYRQGGNIRQSLTDYGELLEDRRRAQLQERIGKLSAKMTMVMVLFMFPALLIFVAGPGVFGLLRAMGGK